MKSVATHIMHITMRHKKIDQDTGNFTILEQLTFSSVSSHIQIHFNVSGSLKQNLHSRDLLTIEYLIGLRTNESLEIILIIEYIYLW